MPERVYVVVDAGLSRGAQAAQAIHAVAELVANHPAMTENWSSNGNVVIVLESPRVEDVLERITTDEDYYGVGLATFNEPDFDGTLTAFAVFSGTLGGEVVNVLLSDLPLAGKKPRWPWQERKLQKRESELRGSGVLR